MGQEMGSMLAAAFFLLLRFFGLRVAAMASQRWRAAGYCCVLLRGLSAAPEACRVQTLNFFCGHTLATVTH